MSSKQQLSDYIKREKQKNREMLKILIGLQESDKLLSIKLNKAQQSAEGLKTALLSLKLKRWWQFWK